MITFHGLITTQICFICQGYEISASTASAITPQSEKIFFGCYNFEKFLSTNNVVVTLDNPQSTLSTVFLEATSLVKSIIIIISITQTDCLQCMHPSLVTPPKKRLFSVDSEILKFFGFKFWHILSFTVTGLSPVLSCLMLTLSYQANSSQFVLSMTNHEKSLGSTRFVRDFHMGSDSYHIHNAWQKTSHSVTV